MLVDESYRYTRGFVAIGDLNWCINYTLICFFSPINVCILRILSCNLVNFDMQIKVEAKDLLWSRLYEKYFS